MGNQTVIEVSNLSKKFELRHPLLNSNNKLTTTLWALNDVSFTVNKGETIGIIGPNGSGKSTLLKILSGITKPTSGNVKIIGRVASILDIGAGFHPELSGKENIFLNGQLLGFTKQEIKNKYDEMVDFSGIEKFIAEPVKNYSNGMYLRLAFSIMAHLDFDVYLLDEVMNVGDAAFRQKTSKILTKNKTIILVSHVKEEIINNTTRFLELREGKITETENVNYFTESIDYTKNNIAFEQGKIIVKRREDEQKIFFDIETLFTHDHNYNKSWVVHLKDEMGSTIMAYLGYESIQPVIYNNAQTSTQTFIFNKKLFRSGNYALAFYLAEDKKHLKTNPIDKYHFTFNEKEKETTYRCNYCGPLFYPNTIN